ncbi:NAD(P)-dependent oxidoreductase [Shewanella sp. 4_MG-2023]|uniref:NAD-dependent epimerase/dehydratase family protein n=1 Tax=Shewanella sp. 4_MG-2023 TaxID=3062652 RepID=UPI0026E13CF9|nr:NAD(P)-dependent oxidoreductase [Shewanella sp. 4_MG-2023]MDO6677648.1 NAD(P)-dependent oxidoreductase [Shewanella sp. 4_MG-2023]
MKKILITGHQGLVGRHLWPRLKQAGFNPVGLDLRSENIQFIGDIVNTQRLKLAMSDCDGVIHLAAVSRVVWGQNNPELCKLTNSTASKQLLKLAIESKKRPWVLVSSSREVYGESAIKPVAEDANLQPVNVYGESKLEMEQAAMVARKTGLQTAIVRLANVYGCIEDHHDRVLPAFCRAAVLGEDLRVDGLANTFDFTHISDTVDGLMKIIAKLDAGVADLPPIHLLPGLPTTLEEAAILAIQAAGSKSKILLAPSRNYDVANFVGDASRARSLLGWAAKVTPKQGICQLVTDFERELNNKKVTV